MNRRWLINDLFCKIDITERIVSRLENERYPSNTPIIFCACLKEVLEITKEKVTDLKQRYDAHPEGVLNDELATFHSFLRCLTLPFQLIENAGTDSVPWSLITPLTKSVYSLDKNIQLIMASHYQNYNYYSIDILDYYRKIMQQGPGLANEEFDQRINRKYRQLLGVISSRNSAEVRDGTAPARADLELRRLGFILFPKIERNCIFQQVLLAHEIGHNLFYRYVSQLHDISGEASRVIDRIREDIQISHPDLERTQSIIFIAQKFTDFKTLLLHWIEETFCDIFAMRFFGICALFAAHSFSLGSLSLDEYQGKHPPWRFRLRAMLSSIDLVKLRLAITPANINWGEFHDTQQSFIKTTIERLESKLNEMDEITHLRTDEAAFARSIVTKLAHEILVVRLPIIMNSIEECLGNGSFTSDNPIDLEIALKLCCRLNNGAVPNEVISCVELNWPGNETVDFRHIILAGWIYKVCTLDYIEDDRTFVKESAKANRLILKAIELNDIKREWFETRDVTPAG
ncbi:MAG: hypothetical protein NT002_09970 [candidate division Zixibacteria bacterium]|nr:hypothetical protein [candidate division Zixibacteria bacterium]